MLTRSCLTIAVLALCCNASEAQQPFYAGKQLTILVNYDAGGPTDIEARLLSRHLGRHIAGNPRINVQNMAGAAGMVATKYLGEVASRDGTMVGYFTGATQRYVSIPERFNVDFLSYEFIAAVPSSRIHFMRTDVWPGIKSAADVVKGENIVVGGLGPRQPKDMAMRLTLDMLGARYSYVTSYNSSARRIQRAAARRDQLLRRLADPLQDQGRSGGEGGQADRAVLRPRFRRQGFQRTGLP